jgi:hypothetical protein
LPPPTRSRATLPATIDRADPRNMRIEWDEMPTSGERSREAAEGLAKLLDA